MEKLLLDILNKSENDYEECDFRKLSKVQQKIILILVSNFMNNNKIVRYEEVYVALYNSLTSQKGVMKSLIKSIENNIDSINDYNLNYLFNVIVNNKNNISNIEQLKQYDEYKKEDLKKI